MNREIKFRAWDKRINKWVATGFHVLGEFNLFGGLGDHFMETKEIAKVGSDVDRLSDIEVTQSTSLHDRNGKEIYEGDVVAITRHGETINHAIIYQSGAWRLEPDGPYPTRYICEFKSSIVEVIGNIYENKELLT